MPLHVLNDSSYKENVMETFGGNLTKFEIESFRMDHIVLETYKKKRKILSLNAFLLPALPKSVRPSVY